MPHVLCANLRETPKRLLAKKYVIPSLLRILEESWAYLCSIKGIVETTVCNGRRSKRLVKNVKIQRCIIQLDKQDQPMKDKLLIIFALAVVFNVKRVDAQSYVGFLLYHLCKEGSFVSLEKSFILKAKTVYFFNRNL